MIKLNTGFSRKVGEPSYGSRGASVNVELELEGHLIQDPGALQQRIRQLFTLAKAAVDEELSGAAAPAPASPPAETVPERNATASQLRAIRAIANRLGLDPQIVTRDELGAQLDQLTLRQASTLIDRLKQRNGNDQPHYQEQR